MWVVYIPSKFLFLTVFVILLYAVAFLGIMYLASISDSYVVRDECSAVRAEEFNVSNTKGVWITSDVHLDCASAVGFLLKNLYATNS